MKALYLTTLALAAFLSDAVVAKELEPNVLTAQLYASGAVHEKLMALKKVSTVGCWARSQKK